MNNAKKLLIRKILEIHNYLSILDKTKIEEIEINLKYTKNNLTKEIVNEYLEIRRKNK